jgi:carboxynorspermidine decarboxylase
LFPRLRGHLQGTTGSSLNEARLGHEEFGGETHVYMPAYRAEEWPELTALASHVVFNSFAQWERFGSTTGAARPVFGLRINPEHSEAPVPLYDPCRTGSRFGVRADQLAGRDLGGITGLHFHTLCEQNADALERTLAAVEAKFGGVLGRMAWLNMGGGHHITRADYDLDRLCRNVERVRDTYGLEVYLEPGEAVVLNAGYLVATVLDIMENEGAIALLDTSAAAHMPDVLEMPYRPEVLGAGAPGRFAHTYRLAGATCLAGDEIGTYSFPDPLRAGDRVVFTDMAHYTMVKNNTFNGVALPSIALYDPEKGGVRVLRTFGYEDYRSRLS